MKWCYMKSPSYFSSIEGAGSPTRLKQLFNRKMWIIEEVVDSGDLKLKFGEGRVKLFWKDKEISKDVGLTTSLHYGDCWFDSTQANWKLEKQSDNKIDILAVHSGLRPLTELSIFE